MVVLIGLHLAGKYNVQTKVVAIDLASKDVSFSELESAIQEIDVGVLGRSNLPTPRDGHRSFVCLASSIVNNAGVSHYMPVPFAETPDQEISNILQVVRHALCESKPH